MLTLQGQAMFLYNSFRSYTFFCQSLPMHRLDKLLEPICVTDYIFVYFQSFITDSYVIG